MATLIHEPRSARFTDLAADVAASARDLADAHAEQLKAEVSSEARRALCGTLTLVAGGGLLAIGAIFGLVAVVMLLTDRYGYSPYFAWGVVGFTSGALGLIAALVGQQQLHNVSIVPQHTLQSLRESLRWISQR